MTRLIAIAGFALLLATSAHAMTVDRFSAGQCNYKCRLRLRCWADTRWRYLRR